MVTTKKITLAIGIVAVAAIFGFLLLTGVFMTQQKSPTQEENALNTIIESVPPFSHKGQPIIEIDSLSRHNGGWYIVSLKPVRAYEGYVPIKVIMYDTGGTLKIISGPDTYFSEPELLKLNVPDSVILELHRS